MTRTVALTGATGFIGNHLARALSEAGYRVRSLERSPRGSACPAAAERVIGSLADSAALDRLVTGAEAVVHCAGTVRGAGSRPFFATNSEGTERLARVIADQPAPPRLLLISSLAARQPDLSPYAASKRAAEERLARLGDRLSWAAFRPPAVYGAGDRGLVPVLGTIRRGVAPLLGRPGARFSLLHGADLASAVRAWLDRPEADGRIYELHDGQPGGYSWDRVIEAVARTAPRGAFRLRIPRALAMGFAGANLGLAWLTGRDPMITPAKIRELRHPDWVCENTDIARSLGWQPRVGLEEGLAALFPSGARSTDSPRKG